MPLELNAHDLKSRSQKIKAFATRFIDFYEAVLNDDIIFPEDISKKLNELPNLNVPSEKITTIIEFQLASSTNPLDYKFMYYGEYAVNPKENTNFQEIITQLSSQQQALSFTYDRRYQNTIFSDMLKYCSVCFDIRQESSKNKQCLKAIKSVFHDLTQPGPLSELTTVANQLDFATVHGKDELYQGMPLINKITQKFKWSYNNSNSYPSSIEDIVIWSILILALYAVSD